MEVRVRKRVGLRDIAVDLNEGKNSAALDGIRGRSECNEEQQQVSVVGD